jgi:sec-independent protein translocase protein TatA
MFEAPWHWVVLALVALILFFGWKQLPDMARSLGRSLRIFKTEIKGMSQDDKARESAKSEPAAIEAPQPRSADAPLAQTPAADRPRPRPTPSANGRAETPARAE